MKIIIIGALPSSLINFRGFLIKDFLAEGHEVVAVADICDEETICSIESLGCKYIPVAIQRNGLSPLADVKTFRTYLRIFQEEKPDIIVAYTIKPVIWGGIAARLYKKAKFYALITGLGFAFQKGGLKRKIIGTIAKNLYRLSLNNCESVIFQNEDNRTTFVEQLIIPKEKTHIVEGSGVKLDHYSRTPIQKKDKTTFLTIARLLGDKGIREYAEAAKILNRRNENIEFQIIGPEDTSPDGISTNEILGWHKSGFIRYLGSKTDVRPFIVECDVYVLASYHEGMPRTILEAMAIGRPILTTNVSGCKETVNEGINGFLVQHKNVDALVDKMQWFIDNKDRWQIMADESYKLVSEKFTVEKVNKKMLYIFGLKTNNL